MCEYYDVCRNDGTLEQEVPMGTDSLYYIMDYSGNYYRTDKADQLVAVAGEQDATVFTFAQANSRILCKFFNKKAFALECYFRYNNLSISL